MILNIVLTLWLLRQRETIQAFAQESHQAPNRDLDKSPERPQKADQVLQNLKPVKSDDEELDDYLAKYKRIGKGL
jgi:hypothetical protein